MSGFVKELFPRMDAIEYAARELRFPWPIRSESLSLENGFGRRCGSPLVSRVDYPPFSRSTRDGYALRSGDVAGASDTSPVFLRVGGEIPMGAEVHLSLEGGECVAVHTGGMIPRGADAVVMLEDTVRTGNWLEVRKSLQSGENVIFKGEEIAFGSEILAVGEMLDYRNVGVLATLGSSFFDALDLKIGILSTGDEIVPADTLDLPAGKVRDANACFLEFLLARHGFPARRLGIVPDRKEALEESVLEGLEENDVLLVSGGSSVSTRDHCSEILENLPEPGLLVRGVNMSPGKPLLIAGSLARKRLVLGLPGHPLSCSIVAITVLLPLLHRLIGSKEAPLKSSFASLSSDVIGKAGVEEFVPALMVAGKARPVPGKSGYVGVLREARGLIRLTETEETRRAGDTVEVLEW